MKVAHVILAHAFPRQVKRLVKRLSSPNAHIYIHIDAKSDLAAFRSIAKIANVFFIKQRVAVTWGDYNMVEATLNSFKQVLESGIAYTHINLMSGQDYPLKPAADIEKFLFANTDKSYMQWLDIDKSWHDGRVRLERYNLGNYHFPGKYKLEALINFILPKRKMPDGLKAYGRSQWFTITPECAAYSLDYIEAQPKLEQFFKHTWGVDEIFFQTILVNSPYRPSLVNTNLMYLEEAGASPRTLVMRDAEKLTYSGKLFARKFDINVDARILDRLDELAASHAA